MPRWVLDRFESGPWHDLAKVARHSNKRRDNQMKTAQEYMDALKQEVQSQVDGFNQVLTEYGERQVDEVEDYLTELGLTDASDEVRNFVSNAIRTTLVLAVLADLVGGVPPIMVMLAGMSPQDIGQQIVANSTQGETNLNQFAELLVEVHSAVTGTPVERDENGTVDVHAYLNARDTFPGPADLAQEVIDAFHSQSTNVAA